MMNCMNSTPPKANMEPENEPLEEEIPIKNTIIFRFHVSFRGCILPKDREKKSFYQNPSNLEKETTWMVNLFGRVSGYNPRHQSLKVGVGVDQV